VLDSLETADYASNFLTKRLRSKRRSSPCIFQVVVSLGSSLIIATIVQTVLASLQTTILTLDEGASLQNVGNFHL
jgi:hypothetical protein